MWYINKLLTGGTWWMWVIGLLVLVPGIFFLVTWLFMVLEGALGNMFGFRTLGYWESAIVVMAIELLVALIFSHKSK